MNEARERADGEQTLISHLIELRARLLKSIAAVAIAFLALFPFRDWLYTQLAQPLVRFLPHSGHLIATEVASPFFTPIKLAAVVALMVAIPVVIYQLWAFVSPGLYRHERRLARPLLLSAVLLFYGGCAFAYFVVMPAAFRFLTAVTPQGVEMMTDISHYLSFVLTLFFAFGLCFEVPVAVVIMAAIGVVKLEKLRSIRGYVLVGCFVAAAILTPPDVMSQILLAVPMYALYEIGILAVRVLIKPSAASADDGAG